MTHAANSEAQLKNVSRLNWIDQAKGLTIFLVVYGHNFPFTEKYIYSFHMPLFIMMAGFFHPSDVDGSGIKKRFQSIVVPYFIWSFSLFLFWFLVARKFGESATMGLSPFKNFVGVFYSQGGREYMDWSIPLWFLPMIFCVFVIFAAIRKIKNDTLYLLVLLTTIAAGFVYTRLETWNLPWSLNIAMAVLAFYALGFHYFDRIQNTSKSYAILLMVVCGLLNLVGFDYNMKIDIYRAHYGNEWLFIFNGLTGSLMVLFFFKLFPVFRFLELIGKFSLTILAAQLIALTFIKFILLLVLGQKEFNFSETERFVYSIVQILLMVPWFFVLNKYLPILNGGYKKI